MIERIAKFNELTPSTLHQEKTQIMETKILF